MEGGGESNIPVTELVACVCPFEVSPSRPLLGYRIGSHRSRSLLTATMKAIAMSAR